MAGGGEIITLGVGNYGVLTASHWANSTTRHDAEHRVVYKDSRRGPATVRMLLLDHAQPSRIRKVMGLGDAGANEEPTDMRPPEEAAYDPAEDDEVANDDHYTWTWNTATRHPAAAAAQQYRDPHSAAARDDDDDDEDEDDEDADHREAQPNGDDIDELAEELKGAPPMTMNPWWRYIAVPVNRESLLTNAYFDDPMGGLLGHSFGFGYHQSFDSSLFVDGGGRSNGRIARLDTYADRLRRELEDADGTQGIQLFTDGDSAFGGVTCALLKHLADDHGDVRATVAHTAFPTASFEPGTDFAKRRREEVILNRALCVSHLAEFATIFTPYETATWDMKHLRAFDSNDDVATAAVIAAVSDNTFYAARQRATAPEKFRSLGQTCGLMRVSDSMRMTAAACALPFRIPEPTRSAMSRSGRGGEDHTRASLWSVLQGSPLMDEESWVPLSHSFKGANAVQLESGRVESHVMSGRGFASHPDVEYPRDEALLRYAYPMRTSRYAVDLYDEQYPVSASFPTERFFGAAKHAITRDAKAPAADGTVREAAELGGFALGSHLLNTYQSGPYLRALSLAAEPVMRYAKHTHGDAYGFESDEWRDTIETLQAVRDAYDFEAVHDVDDEDLE